MPRGKELGASLRAIREAAGLRVTDLAAVLGCVASCVCDIEAGRRNIGYALLGRWVASCGGIIAWEDGVVRFTAGRFVTAEKTSQKK